MSTGDQNYANALRNRHKSSQQIEDEAVADVMEAKDGLIKTLNETVEILKGHSATLKATIEVLHERINDGAKHLAACNEQIVSRDEIIASYREMVKQLTSDSVTNVG